MDEHDVPDDLSALDEELSRPARRGERRIDPGPTAVAVAVGMLALIGGLLLPWTGSVLGWQVVAGTARLGLLPPLFAFCSLGFGLVVSAFALATRWWGLAWLAAVGCGFSVVVGVLALWSRQVAVTAGASGPGLGLVVAELAIVVLTVSWVRIVGRR